MNVLPESIIRLRQDVVRAEQNLQIVKDRLAHAESSAALANPDLVSEQSSSSLSRWPLSSEEYHRYGRQMIVPSFGVQGIH
jgi:adenylyltransferase/sulfurtransferase